MVLISLFLVALALIWATGFMVSPAGRGALRLVLLPGTICLVMAKLLSLDCGAAFMIGGDGGNCGIVPALLAQVIYPALGLGLLILSFVSLPMVVFGMLAEVIERWLEPPSGGSVRNECLGL